MRAGTILIAAAAAASLSIGSPAAAPKRQAAAADWTRTVVATPQGGFRMGNPNARVKLVEYGSLTCPHCRHFAETGYKPLLAGYVRTGKLSYEYRNMVLNGIDVAATLVARCGGAPKFFALAADLYATQPQWVGKVANLSDDQKAALQKLPNGAQIARIAEIAGITTIAQRRGIAPARAKACAANGPALERLTKMYEAALAQGVTGTPTFFVNGKKVGAMEWSELEPELRKAGG